MIGLAFLALICRYTCLLLLRCKDIVVASYPQHEHDSMYATIGRAAFGNVGAAVVNVTIITALFGALTSFLILASGSMQSVFPVLSVRSWLFIMVICSLLLNIVHDFRLLSWISGLGIIALLGASTVVIWYGVESFKADQGDYVYVALGTCPVFFGVATFSFAVHSAIFPLEEACGDKDRFCRVLDAAILFVTAFYFIFGVGAYLLYGDATEEIVLLNLPGGIVADIVKVPSKSSLQSRALSFRLPDPSLPDTLFGIEGCHERCGCLLVPRGHDASVRACKQSYLGI